MTIKEMITIAIITFVIFFTGFLVGVTLSKKSHLDNLNKIKIQYEKDRINYLEAELECLRIILDLKENN